MFDTVVRYELSKVKTARGHWQGAVHLTIRVMLLGLHMLVLLLCNSSMDGYLLLPQMPYVLTSCAPMLHVAGAFL